MPVPELVAALSDIVDELKDELVSILEETISIPSTSPSGEMYGDMIDAYREIFSRLSIPHRVITVPQDFVDEHCPREARGNPRYILEARLPGGSGIIGFNGHYDVVPGGPGWTVSEPFKPRMVGNRLYGRGAVDMKGGIASVITAMAAVREAGLSPPNSIVVHLVPDEEIGGECGTGWLVENVSPLPGEVYIPEPSRIDRVWHGHKGALWAEVRIRGTPAHASTPWLGVNAFLDAARLALWLEEHYAKAVGRHVSRYTYDLPGAERATAMIGGVAGVEGGGKTNQVPGAFTFTVDRRVIPEETVGDARRELEEYLARAAVELGLGDRVSLRVVHEMEAVVSSPDSPPVKRIRGAASLFGVEVVPSVCMGGLDLRYYAVKGIPTVAYDSGNETPHAPNEYVDVGEALLVSKIYSVIMAGVQA